MRVLVTALPQVGHLLPVLPLARALRDRGHDVRVATHPSRRSIVVGQGLDLVAAGWRGAEIRDERLRRWPETAEQPAMTWSSRTFAQIAAPVLLRDLRPYVERWRPDLIVHDEGELAAPVLGHLLDVPWITHGWGSPPRPAWEVDELAREATGLWASAGLGVPDRAGLGAHATVDPCPPSLGPSGTADHGAPRWAQRPVPVRLPDADVVEPSADDTVYVGFGTIPLFADAADELMTAMTVCAALGLRAVVSAATQATRQRLRDVAGPTTIVSGRVSLPDLLPRCRLVICHGGAGTTLAALASGVPLVMTPRGTASQLRMVEACARAGVAEVAALGDLAGLAGAIRSAIGDAALAGRARALADEIAALPEPAEVAAEVERFTEA